MLCDKATNSSPIDFVIVLQYNAPIMPLRFSPIALFLCASVLAQSPKGTITGTISDVSGARVPGVEVVAKHTATNLTYKGTSSGDGTYVIPALPVGAFEVSATVTGFKAFRRTGIVLEVSQRLRLDISLEIGAATETVTVSGQLSRVTTEESALGTVVERQRIEQLPLNGRHVFNLVKLVAGVQPRTNSTDGFAEISNQGFSQIRFNGGPIYGNQFFLDGGSNTVPVHNEISVVPMVDAVEEFKVETNSLKAEYGQTSGGIVNVVTKAGTNVFHGSAYEFFRNDSLDARNAYATQRDPITGRIKPVLRYNQFGGTLGGPIRIPKIYDGRNKTFFYFGYEQWRHRSATLRRSTVATAQERAGDFSNTRDGRGVLLPIYDPATTRANPNWSGFVRDLFAGNIVPKNRFDPLSERVLAFMPLANQAASDPFTNSLNFLGLASSPSDQGVTNIRFDHRFTDKDSAFFRYSGNRNTRQDKGFGLGPADPNARNDQRDNHNFIFTETHIFSPTVINEFKANVTRQNLPFLHPSFDQGWPEKLGYPKIIPQDQFPPVTISGLISIGSSGFSGGKRAQHSVQFADSLTWIRGRHQVKFGVDLRYLRLNWVNRLNPSGLFNFTAGLTNNPLVPAGTGFGLATFLLGEVSSGQVGIRPFFSFHNWSLGNYVQDDFKITPRLTLNLGLRYDIVSGPVERHNKHSNFDPFLTNPQTSLPGILTYAGATAPRHFVGRDRNNFGPRFGFAYDLTGDGKTAIRGGYGLVYLLSESTDTSGDSSNSLGFEVVTPFVAPTSGPFKAFQFSAGPTAILQPLGAAGGPSAFRGLDVRYQDYNARTPYIQQWNLTVQRQIIGNWVATVSYAGNRGVKLFGGDYDLNQMDPAFFSLGLALQNQVPNPYFRQIITGGISGATVPRSQLLRPYSDYSLVDTLANHGASSTYHSLQVTVEKRYSNGLSVLTSYTNGKLINDSFASAGSGGGGGEYRVGRFNRRLERAIDQDDVSQRLVISGVYELPFGKGKQFLAGVNSITQAVLGGWQVNGIATAQTGFPLRVRGANNFTGIAWPNVLADPSLPGGQRTAQKWFNTEVFRNPDDFTIGNIGRTLPNTRSPGLFDVSFSGFKEFRIRERVNLEFRGELFNALNRVNLNTPNSSFTPNRAGVNTNANFGAVTSSLNARSIQLGLRLAF